MHRRLSFRASGIPPEDLGRILCDYLALDRARIVRRLMVVRCGLFGVAAALLETVIHGFSPLARLVTVGVCLVPPAWAWVVELGWMRRVARAARALPDHA